MYWPEGGCTPTKLFMETPLLFEFFVEAFPLTVAAWRKLVVLLSKDKESCCPSCCEVLYPVCI